MSKRVREEAPARQAGRRPTDVGDREREERAAPADANGIALGPDPTVWAKKVARYLSAFGTGRNPRGQDVWRVGQYLSYMDQYQGYRQLQCETRGDWLKTLPLEFQTWRSAEQYIQIQEGLELQEVIGKQLGKNALLEIVRAQEEFRPALLAACEGPTKAGVLKLARSALQGREAEEAPGILERFFAGEAIETPDGPVQIGWAYKKTPEGAGEEVIAGLGKAVKAATRLDELQAEGKDLPAEELEELIRYARGAYEYLEGLRKAPAGPAGGEGAGGSDEGKQGEGEEDKDQGEGEEDEDQGEGEPDASQAAGAEFVSVPMPARRSPYEVPIAISFPRKNPRPTPAERRACTLITLNSHLVDTIDRVRKQFCVGDRVLDRLMLHYKRAVDDYGADVFPFCRLIKQGSLEGKALLAQLQAESPESPLNDLVPIPFENQTPIVPMAWVSVSLLDPLGDEIEATKSEKDLWFALGLLDLCKSELGLLTQDLDQGAVIDPLLCHELDELVRDGSHRARTILMHFQTGIGRAEAEEGKAGNPHAERLSLIEQAEAHMVCFGASTRVNQFGKIGLLADGRQAALPLDRALSLVALGGLGFGKSHLGVLLIEMLLLALEGLNRLYRPGVPIVLAADFRLGRTRHQHLCGVDPNPNPAQQRWLRQYFHVKLSPMMSRLKRILTFVPVGTVPNYRRAYPDLMERGVEFRELRFHTSEWTSFVYKAMMCGQDGSDRPMYQSFVENTVAGLGQGADPGRVWQEFDEAGVGGGSKHTMRKLFELMMNMTSQTEHLGNAVFEKDALLLFLLESAWLGQDLILPMQAAIMNILMRAAPEALHLLFVLEEPGKLKLNPLVLSFLEELFRMKRHHLHSVFTGAQMCRDLPGSLITLASGVVQMGGCSPADLTRLKELRHQAGALSYGEMATLEKRTARLLFSEASDPRLVTAPPLAYLRPSCVWAGGETIITG